MPQSTRALRIFLISSLKNKKLTVSVSTSLLFSKTEMNSSVKEMNKQSPGEEGQMADKHMKRCST